MYINTILKALVSMPPHDVVKVIANKINIKVKDRSQKSKDLRGGDTHINFDVPLVTNSYMDFKELDVTGIEQGCARYLSKMYCDHRFDLLGSGWVKNSYDSVALGVEGYKYDMNLAPPKSVVDGYEPIDWQKDYKSGYRWSEKKWYKEQRIGHKLGSDIKVPWELARLQHLPQLAIFSMVDESLKIKNLKEFKYQVLDFIENNPPRLGVNWVCTMDVGIRVANMLVAYDLFSQMDNFNLLDNPFKQKFANSIYEHGFHIINNLEYSELITSNHYLSNIVGLLFVSVYLDSDSESNRWLAFSIQELISETKKQFYRDGGNFESSTSYHRLSGELVCYAVALIQGLKEKRLESLKSYTNNKWKVKPSLNVIGEQEFGIEDRVVFPRWFIEKLQSIGNFTSNLSREDGTVPQFGDNDSGRLFRFSPVGEFITTKQAIDKYINLKDYPQDSNNLFWDESSLNHSTFTSAVDALFKDTPKTHCFIKLEGSIIQSLSNGALFTPKDLARHTAVPTRDGLVPTKLQHKEVFKSNSDFCDVQLVQFPDSGIYIFKAFNLHLAIAITPMGQNNYGGHKHNDELTYELEIDGNLLVKDPGTYLYTPLPDRRNEFRGTAAHHTPYLQNEERHSCNGLFALSKKSNVFVNDFGSNFIEFALLYRKVKILRRFELLKNKLTISDFCDHPLSFPKFKLYSNGYGKVEINE